MTVYRAVFVQSIPSIGQIYENACHFKDDSSLMTPAAVAAELAGNFMHMIANWQSNFLGWQTLYLYTVTSSPPPAYILNLANYGGLAATGYLYPTLCYKLKYQTLIGGRHGRGRFYVAGGRNDWSTAGGVNGTGATNGGIWANNILARYGGSGSGPVSMGVMPTGGGAADYHAISAIQFWQYLGQQRRRNYGVGI